jgi:hypothetical protein
MAHVVVLVHGIRDFALWQTNVRATLEKEGFKTEATNYGRLNLIQFLLPFSYFRKKATETVWKELRIIKQNNEASLLSIIAHSFGTYVVAHLMQENFDIKFHRVIFCGSVVRYGFPIEQFQDRFSQPILNEVGTRDVWPAMAESITTGYGSAGTYGFRRPLVRDRWHNGARHGFFLDADFCKKFWVPFLRDGTVVTGSDSPEPPSFWTQLITIVKIKFVVILLLLSCGFVFYKALNPPVNNTELLRHFLYPHGFNNPHDPSRADAIQSCMRLQGLDNISITLFLYGDKYAAQRGMCVKALKLDQPVRFRPS